MREMKDSEIEWVKQIPSNWQALKGKHVLTIMKRPPEGYEEVITCFRDGEVTRRSNRRDDGFTFADKEIGYQGICVGDLVIHGMDGFAGAIGISDSNGKGSPVLSVCKPKYENNTKYFMYYLRMLAIQNVFLALATGIRERSCDLRWNKIAELLFPIPPLLEQNCIASFLDTKSSLIDAAIEKERGIIEKLKEYRQAVITEAVTRGIRAGVPMKDSGVEWIGEIPEGWDVQKIKSYYSIVNGSTPKSDKSEYWGGDIIWITPAEMSSSIVEIYDSKRTITEEGLQSCGTTLLPINSIILSTRAPIGQVCIAGTNLCTNQGCKSLVMRKEFNYKYSYYYLSSQTVTLNILGRGTTFMELSTYDLANYPLPIPPLPEQQEIADYLDAKCSAIDATIQKRELAIEKLTAYKQSLIYECVTGKREVLG